MTYRLFFLLLTYLFLSTHAFASVSSTERNALVALYESTNGPSWANNTNWLVGDPCENQWAGVFCDNKLIHIETIVLGENNLRGFIPRKIGNLNYLRWLYLSNNHLSGIIPVEITNLTLFGLSMTFNCNLVAEDKTVENFITTANASYQHILDTNGNCKNISTSLINYLLF